MPSHRIQLRGPWEYLWLGTGPAELPFSAAGRVKMPAGWRSLFGEIAGRARFTRRFNRPTNLEPHERVLVVLEQPVGSARLRLNGRMLGVVQGGAKSAGFDVTGLLKATNELVVDIDLSPHAGVDDLWQTVAIEIEAA